MHMLAIAWHACIKIFLIFYFHKLWVDWLTVYYHCPYDSYFQRHAEYSKVTHITVIVCWWCVLSHTSSTHHHHMCYHIIKMSNVLLPTWCFEKALTINCIWINLSFSSIHKYMFFLKNFPSSCFFSNHVTLYMNQLIITWQKEWHLLKHHNIIYKEVMVVS